MFHIDRQIPRCAYLGFLVIVAFCYDVFLSHVMVLVTRYLSCWNNMLHFGVCFLAFFFLFQNVVFYLSRVLPG